VRLAWWAVNAELESVFEPADEPTDEVVVEPAAMGWSVLFEGLVEES
jgi:hypothetical protein